MLSGLGRQVKACYNRAKRLLPKMEERSLGRADQQVSPFHFLGDSNQKRVSSLFFPNQGSGAMPWEDTNIIVKYKKTLLNRLN